MTSRTVLGLPWANSLVVGVLSIGSIFNLVAWATGNPFHHVIAATGMAAMIPQLGMGPLTTADRQAGRKAPGWALPVAIAGQILLIVSILIRFS